MAQLFSVGNIKSHVGVIGGYDQMEAVDIIQRLYDDFRKGLMKNETAYEQTFNQLFFVELLGYLPNDNLRPKAGTPIGGKIADAALGIFPDGHYIDSGVQVAVELKDCMVSLDKKQNRSDAQTPVEQGFGYKTSFSGCKWLIVSNFFVTRLYRDNKQDYEEWTLEQLMDPSHDYFHLRRLLLLLHKDRLLKIGTQESHTEKLLTQFRIQQQAITKKFYTDYKSLRFELINDIRLRNQEISIPTAVEKSQKIIDRIVFIHFCEDKGLLPADKLKENVLRAAEADFTPWEVLKRYFKGVDTGSEKLHIPHGYNGELFKPDPILDVLIIGDAICRKFIDLGNYNFDDELSVNILGHIFEQSISDIEQLKIDLLGHALDTDQLIESKKTSKRKKDGIFYTPEYIVDYIVENTLMKYLSEKEEECLSNKKYKSELDAYQAYQYILQNIKVVDPACGSGAFLVKVFDRLFDENKRIGTIINNLFSDDEIYKNILTNNIYGVDLNPESVEITKLSLWLKSAQKGRKLNNLNENIKCGNSLIHDSTIAGERAFNREYEFIDIFTNGGFDIVVGNPPYVSYYSKQSQADEKTKDEIERYKKNYKFMSNKKVKGGRYNTVMFFIEHILYILKEGGNFGIIVDTNIHSNPFEDIRKYLLDNAQIKIIVDKLDVFEGVGSSQLIMSGIKMLPKDGTVDYIQMIEGNAQIVGSIKQKELKKKNKYDIRYMQKSSIVDKLDNFTTIQELIGKNNIVCCISFTGKKDSFVIDAMEQDNDYPLLEGSSGVAGPYSDIKYHNYVRYDLDLVKKLNNDYNIKAEKENKRSAMAIYFPTTLNKFKAPKIFVRLSDSRLTGTYTDKVVCADLSLYMITLDNLQIQNEDFNLLYILAIINSKLATYYFIKKGRIRNLGTGTPQIRVNDLRNLPLKQISLIEQKAFVELVNGILDSQKKIADFKISFLGRIRDNLTNKTTKVLENFEEITFMEFIKELSKQKIKFTLSQQDERQPYFDEYKEKINTLKIKIEGMKKEIDEKIYTLYGLDQSERVMIESGVQ